MKRCFVLLAAAVAMLVAETPVDPWTASQLVEPKAFAEAIQAGHEASFIVMVGPRVLYDGAHVAGARYGGPANTAEGVLELLKVAKDVSKDAPIVIYCGCCPMTRCPNIRPAFAALRAAGFKNVKILALSESMHADWTEKGYPTEKPR